MKKFYTWIISTDIQPPSNLDARLNLDFTKATIAELAVFDKPFEDLIKQSYEEGLKDRNPEPLIKKVFKKLLCYLDMHKWESTPDWTWKCRWCPVEERQT